MKNITFEWNASKASANKQKHKVSFEEAKSAFLDENALVIHDPEHSHTEDRFILLGQSTTPRLLVVCHCYRKKDSIIRIISARKATKKESIQYYGDYL
jgi:uncharacterized protein